MFGRKNSSEFKSLDRGGGTLEHTPFNRHETVSTIARREPQQFRIIHPDGYILTVIHDVCRNNDVRADHAYFSAAAGERVCLRESRETHTGFVSLSPNKKSEKADGIIRPHVEKHGPFEDYAARETWTRRTATGYPADSSIKIIYK